MLAESSACCKGAIRSPGASLGSTASPREGPDVPAGPRGCPSPHGSSRPVVPSLAPDSVCVTRYLIPDGVDPPARCMLL